MLQDATKTIGTEPNKYAEFSRDGWSKVPKTSKSTEADKEADEDLDEDLDESEEDLEVEE